MDSPAIGGERQIAEGRDGFHLAFPDPSSRGSSGKESLAHCLTSFSGSTCGIRSGELCAAESPTRAEYLAAASDPETRNEIRALN
jgi:hypothetical protein